ncbi:hypothetical protein PISMIDRAFT_672288 [Pisolithus microcarpus 441]|uniref:Unplaced genomic scaffold scaffold_5, whole genome shotgun sequence n=1 Tax=Pisolithus microcarpus 441 TaxID=765257 RepID=A0A0C9YWW3_9AGAM|nr:hypothetical protein PISMIDRAFT_672288 [Pisolithus microcarpus 441]
MLEAREKRLSCMTTSGRSATGQSYELSHIDCTAHTYLRLPPVIRTPPLVQHRLSTSTSGLPTRVFVTT